jgi:hypothetical protein
VVWVPLAKAAGTMAKLPMVIKETAAAVAALLIYLRDFTYLKIDSHSVFSADEK